MKLEEDGLNGLQTTCECSVKMAIHALNWLFMDGFYPDDDKIKLLTLEVHILFKR